MAVIKRQVYRHTSSDFGSALDESNQLTDLTAEGEDFQEGVNALVERRPPRFSPLSPDAQRPFE
jgi:enoyl-CoA hydratase/carnithine racemase